MKIGGAKIVSRRVTLTYHAARDTTLVLRQFAFTGWQCRIDGGPWATAGVQRLGTSPRSVQVPLCPVPAGTHRLDARLPESSPERFGFWMGFAGLAMVLATLCVASLGSAGRRRAGVPVQP